MKFYNTTLFELSSTDLSNFNRVAFINAMNDVIFFNKMTKMRFTQKTCREHIWDAKYVIYFPKNFYLIDAVDKKISGYLSSGIINHFISRYVDLRYWKVKPEQRGPQKLRLAHLEGAFILWFAMVVVSCVSFSIELAMNYFNQRVN